MKVEIFFFIGGGRKEKKKVVVKNQLEKKGSKIGLTICLLMGRSR